MVFGMRLTVVVTCLASPVLGQDGYDAIKPEIARIAAEQVQTAMDESVHYLDRPIETEGNCRRIDLSAYKQDNPYFMTDFETAILACEQAWAPTYWRDWGALEHARNKPDPQVYELAVETRLELAGARDPDDFVVELAITRGLIANHMAGMPQAEATMQAFLQCVDYSNQFANWSSQTYPPIPPVRREQNRGQIICGE